MAKLILNLLPANTIAAFIAELVTKALSKISNKEKAALISKAVADCGAAVQICGKAVEDCKITEEEVNSVSDSIQVAVKSIIEAAK